MRAMTEAVSDLEAYGRMMNDSSTRSLYLLRDIEKTVLAVGTIRDSANSYTQTVIAFNVAMAKLEGRVPEEAVLDLFEDLQGHLEKLHTQLEISHKSAKADPELCDEDGVADVFRDAINAVCSWHEQVEMLRWNILQHNAALDTSDPGVALTSAEQIDEFLATL